MATNFIGECVFAGPPLKWRLLRTRRDKVRACGGAFGGGECEQRGPLAGLRSLHISLRGSTWCPTFATAADSVASIRPAEVFSERGLLTRVSGSLAQTTPNHHRVYESVFKSIQDNITKETVCQIVEEGRRSGTAPPS